MNKLTWTDAKNRRLIGSLLRLGNRVAARRNCLPILAFHRVLENPDPLQPDVIHKRMFEDVIELLVSTFQVLPLGEAVEKLKRSNLEKGIVAITFDDGYFDNFSIAMPILLKYQVPATFFIATGYMNGGIMFNDCIIQSISRTKKDSIQIPDMDFIDLKTKTLDEKINAIDILIKKMKHLTPGFRNEVAMRVMDIAQVKPPNNLMMKTEHLKRLAGSGMDVGGHTKTHPILTSVNDDVAEYEIKENKADLESILNRRVDLFAYPNGKFGKDFTDKHCRMVNGAGYKAAVSTEWAVANKKCDVFQLPRLAPWDKNPERFIMRILKSQIWTDAVRRSEMTE